MVPRALYYGLSLVFDMPMVVVEDSSTSMVTELADGQEVLALHARKYVGFSGDGRKLG